MTIPEASNLVLQAGEYSKGGEVFLLNMGEQVRIFDLAKKLIHLSGRNISNSPNEDGIQIKEIGLSPGEKLYEELLISGDEINTKNKRIFKSNENSLISLDIMNSWLKRIQLANDKKDQKGPQKYFLEIVEGYNPKD